jgi:hypothetical protein
MRGRAAAGWSVRRRAALTPPGSRGCGACPAHSAGGPGPAPAALPCVFCRLAAFTGSRSQSCAEGCPGAAAAVMIRGIWRGLAVADRSSAGPGPGVPRSRRGPPACIPGWLRRCGCWTAGPLFRGDPARGRPGRGMACQSAGVRLPGGHRSAEPVLFASGQACCRCAPCPGPAGQGPFRSARAPASCPPAYCDQHFIGSRPEGRAVDSFVWLAHVRRGVPEDHQFGLRTMPCPTPWGPPGRRASSARFPVPPSAAGPAPPPACPHCPVRYVPLRVTAIPRMLPPSPLPLLPSPSSRHPSGGWSSLAGPLSPASSPLLSPALSPACPSGCLRSRLIARLNARAHAI